MDAQIDPDAFRDFERAAHSRIAESYTDRFAAVTNRAIDPLLDAVNARSGTRLLDAACGPGLLLAAAAGRGAQATGCDIAPAMIELARRANPGLSADEASADALPYPDGSFDAVTCAFGIGHFPDADKVATEFRRVLAPGGIAALSWWDRFVRNRINGVFHETLGRLGVSAPPGLLPAGPPMDRFSDRERIADFLRAAGFDAVHVAQIEFKHRMRDASELWEMAMGSFARASSMIRAQMPEMQETIRTAVAEAAAPYATKDGLDMPVAFLVAAGIKPIS